MNTRQSAFSLNLKTNAIEWRLLAFLVLFTDVKLAIKLAAIVLIFILQPNFRFGFKMKNSRLPLFYLAMIVIAVINFFIYRNFSINYLAVTLTGILFWAVSIAAIHHIKIFTDRTNIAILHNTLLIFFVLNIAFSFFNLAVILTEIGVRNPFLYQGQYQKYFLNTGDYIKGISFDTSTTNAVINCFGIVYFLDRKNYPLVIACMLTLLLTASNFSNIILLIVFAGLFLFKSNREQKSMMAICAILMVIFLVKLSPQNESYVADTIRKFLLNKNNHFTAQAKIIPIRERPDSLLTPESRREKIAVLYLDSLEREHAKEIHLRRDASLINTKKPELPADSIHTASFQWKRDTTLLQHQVLTYMQDRSANFSKYKWNSPGKIQAFNESIWFLQTHPEKILTGTGTGNFSSKLAFRATGLQVAGSFPQQYEYCSPEFLNNHLGLYTFFLSKHADSHSIIHNPASVYDQLLTEYGLLGFIAFPVYYIGFFIRQLKKSRYGLALLAMLLAFFMVDYWFEQLSIVVLFELMMFINIKEYKPAIVHE